MKKTIFAFVIIMTSVAMSGVAHGAVNGTDAMFKEAQRLAFSGKHGEARAVCLDILKQCEDCVDARILLGRTYAWDKDYESARRELSRALASKPEYADARIALADTELWSGNGKKAAEIYDEGLTLSPGNKDFLYKKAVALESTGNAEGAFETVNELLKIDPANREGRDLAARLEKAKASRSWAFGYTVDSARGPLPSRRNFSFEHSQKTSFGPAHFRCNESRQFNTTAGQFEIDLYPKLSKQSYAYLNAGVSNGKIFPAGRLGAEVYTALGKGFEGSIGFRYLNFSSGNARIYTGSVGREVGNYRIVARPYFSNNPGGGNLSGNLSIRKYLGGDRNNYATIELGLGSSSRETATLQDTTRLDSKRISLDWQHEVGRLVYLLLQFGYENEEYLPGLRRDRYTMGAAIKFLY